MIAILPDLQNVFRCNPVNQQGCSASQNLQRLNGAHDFTNLGDLVSQLFNVAFLIAGLIMFVWAALGIFQYIIAGGNKESLAKARAKITWAIVGFLLLSVAFAFSLFIQEIANPKSITVPRVSDPVAP